jgi:hypothetical protein
VGTTSTNEIFEVKNKLTESKGINFGVYAISCVTDAINTTSAGIGSKHFDFSLEPFHANQIGLTPGLGSMQTKGLGLIYSDYSDPTQARSSTVLSPERLSPEAQHKGDGVYIWIVKPDSNYSVTGTVTKAWVADVDRFKGWILSGLAGTFLTTLILQLLPRFNRSS